MFGEMKVFSGTSHPELAGGIATHMGMSLGKVRITRFSNENIKVKIEENVREADVFVIQTSCPPVSDNLLELLILIDALKFASAGRITAVLPYFPYARSDKKDEARISITARLVADLLQTAGADRVLTMTLHAPQILGFFRTPADQLLATPILTNYFKTTDLSNSVVVATDAGAAKFAGHFAKRLVRAHGHHRQAPLRRHGEGPERGPHRRREGQGRHHLRRRDRHRRLHPGGGPHPAQVRRPQGARGRHPCACSPAKRVEPLNSANLDELVVTDTIPVPPDQRQALPNLKVLSTAALFGDAILRIHGGRSISEMME